MPIVGGLDIQRAQITFDYCGGVVRLWILGVRVLCLRARWRPSRDSTPLNGVSTFRVLCRPCTLGCALTDRGDDEVARAESSMLTSPGGER
jgi:hypothetical protein